MRTVKELFELPQPQKRQALAGVVRWVFAWLPPSDIAIRMMTAEEVFTGKTPPRLTLKSVLDDDNLPAKVAFEFQAEYDADVKETN